MRIVFVDIDTLRPDHLGCYGYHRNTSPNMDKIATDGRQGICQTVPNSMPAGSDVAMMSLLGYDPKTCYTGRAPIEAAAQEIALKEDDWKVCQFALSVYLYAFTSNPPPVLCVPLRSK